MKKIYAKPLIEIETYASGPRLTCSPQFAAIEAFSA